MELSGNFCAVSALYPNDMQLWRIQEKFKMNTYV